MTNIVFRKQQSGRGRERGRGGYKEEEHTQRLNLVEPTSKPTYDIEGTGFLLAPALVGGFGGAL